jgi:hypothetical protein
VTLYFVLSDAQGNYYCTLLIIADKLHYLYSCGGEPQIIETQLSGDDKYCPKYTTFIVLSVNSQKKTMTNSRILLVV